MFFVRYNLSENVTKGLMKQCLLSLLLLCFTLSLAQAQEKAFRKEKRNVMGRSYSGFSVEVPYAEYRSKEYFINYLKDGGKISEKRNFIEVKETYWKPKDNPAKVYALVAGDSSQTRLWIGYSEEATEELVGALQSQMESLPSFIHKQHLQTQIKEAEEAASFLSKELRNTQRDGQRLQRDLERNAEDKMKLEEALKQNATNKIQLEEEIKSNSKSQEAKIQALEEVKRQLEYLKEKISRL